MNFFDAILLVVQPFTLLVIVASGIFGLFVGAMPGLTATMAAALLVPMTFYMDPVPAIGSIVTCSAMAIFAGDIPGAMLRIPGTPASAAYVDEAYLLGQRGKLSLVLSVPASSRCMASSLLRTLSSLTPSAESSVSIPSVLLFSVPSKPSRPSV